MKSYFAERALLRPIFRAFALLLAGAGLATSAFAASDTIVNCDRLESSLRSLDVPVDELASEADDLASATSNAAATVPVAQLTRRATSLTRDVFAALPIVVLDEDGAEVDANPPAETDDARPRSEQSPLVLSPSTPESTRSLAERNVEINTAPQLPRVQRRMYRTDI